MAHMYFEIYVLSLHLYLEQLLLLQSKNFGPRTASQLFYVVVIISTYRFLQTYYV